MDGSRIELIRVVGRGRAGRSLAAVLSASSRVGAVELLAGRDDVDRLRDRDRLRDAGAGAEFVVLAVPDHAIASVSDAIAESPAIVVHLSGALGLDVLDRHSRAAALHPLVSLPNPEIGARRLRGAWCALGGEAEVTQLADALDARWFWISDTERARYHATAAWASNVVVGVLGEVERLAASMGLPLAAFVELSKGSVDNVASVGPSLALTGPVAREDWDTIRGHLDALDDDQRPLYLAGVRSVARLAGVVVPTDIVAGGESA